MFMERSSRFEKLFLFANLEILWPGVVSPQVLEFRENLISTSYA